MNLEEAQRLNWYYKQEFYRIACGAVIFFAIVIAGVMIWSVKNTPSWSFTPIKYALTEDDYYPPEPIEYGAPTVDELDYYHDLAELEERSMGMLMELQEPSQEWFDTYKELNDMYADVGQPDTIEDTSSASELEEMYWVVENEARGGGFEAKVNVANVILNRVAHPKFGNTIHSVVTQPNQFAYHPTSVSEETKQACDYSFLFSDTTNGALFFQRSSLPPNGTEWIMEDDAGHNFFKFIGEDTHERIINESPEYEDMNNMPNETEIITDETCENYDELLEESVG